MTAFTQIREALTDVRAAIMEANPDILKDTLWLPERLSYNETAIDRIDAALEADVFADVETVAKAIYGCFEYQPASSKPPWVDGGNSFKQCDARFYARAVLAAIANKE